MKVLCAFFTYFCLFVCTCQSATYYIDYDKGNNSSAGDSPGTAWKNAPGDPSATGNPSMLNLLPGDVVRFKGGVEYRGKLVISKSGTAANPIVIEGGNLSGWGSGRAIIDLQYQVGAAISFSSAVSYVTTRAFEIRNVGGYSDSDPILQTTCASGPITDPPGGVGILATAGGNTNLNFDDLYFNRIGNWRNTEPFSGTNSITGTGIALENGKSIKITSSEFTKMRVGISVKSTELTDGVEIAQVQIHDFVVWGIDVAPRRDGAILRNIAIRDSIVRDYHQFDSGNWKGCGEKPHTDGIFLRTASMPSTWQNIKIYNNEFYADYPESSQGGTASIYVSQGPSVDIFNNTFRGDRHTRSIGVGHTNPANVKQVVRIYNNSFYRSALPIVLAGEEDTASRQVFIQNNIFYREGNASSIMIFHDSGVPPVVVDNNIYWDPSRNASEKFVYSKGGAYKTFAQLQELGFEKSGFYSDPRFVSVENSPMSANNLGIQVTSPARGKGANLSDIFNFDKVNSSRPISDPWDIGALKYRAGTQESAPRAPKSLRSAQ